MTDCSKSNSLSLKFTKKKEEKRKPVAQESKVLQPLLAH
jgi:hypothetical protein